MQEPLRLLSHNVRYFGHALNGVASSGASVRTFAARLARLDPIADIICLQEVEGASVRAGIVCSHPRLHERQLDTLVGELRRAFAACGVTSPYEGYDFRASVSQFRGVPIAATGLAVLVNVRRFDVQSHNADAPLQITHRGEDVPWYRMQTRICAHMRLADRSGRSLHVFNAHLSLPAPFARTLFWRLPRRLGWAANQLHEARSLASFVRRQAVEEPFVLCADLNSTPASPVFQYLTHEAGFSSAHGALGLLRPGDPAAFATFGVMGVRLHLDHAFCGGGAAWVDLHGTTPFGDEGNVFSGLSDHLPVIGRLRMPA